MLNIEFSDYRSLQNAVFIIVIYKFRNGDFRVVLVTYFLLMCNVGLIAQIRSVQILCLKNPRPDLFLRYVGILSISNTCLGKFSQIVYFVKVLKLGRIQSTDNVRITTNSQKCWSIFMFNLRFALCLSILIIYCTIIYLPQIKKFKMKKKTFILQNEISVQHAVSGQFRLIEPCICTWQTQQGPVRRACPILSRSTDVSDYNIIVSLFQSLASPTASSPWRNHFQCRLTVTMYVSLCMFSCMYSVIFYLQITDLTLCIPYTSKLVDHIF